MKNTIGPSINLLCLSSSKRVDKAHTYLHKRIPNLFDFWADPVVLGLFGQLIKSALPIAVNVCLFKKQTKDPYNYSFVIFY